MNFTFTEAKRFRADSSGGEEEEEESCDEEISGYSNGMVKMPRPGKKTRGRVKVRMEFIKNKLRRYTTFSKRKTGIMKKAYELATLTGWLQNKSRDGNFFFIFRILVIFIDI